MDRKYDHYRHVFTQYEDDTGLEARITVYQGGMFSPYDGARFANLGQSDIEHIVSRREAFDSGLCVQPLQTKRSFITDLNNLTLASPQVNRKEKSDRDAAAWMPPENRCWFAARIVRVKSLYALSVDPLERTALANQLHLCKSFELHSPLQ